MAKQVNKAEDKAYFRHTANKIKSVNLSKHPRRGGIRL